MHWVERLGGGEQAVSEGGGGLGSSPKTEQQAPHVVVIIHKLLA
jgi:hypothetical protein